MGIGDMSLIAAAPFLGAHRKAVANVDGRVTGKRPRHLDARADPVAASTAEERGSDQENCQVDRG